MWWAFARTCLAALDAWWPRSVGWEISNSGYALGSHLPTRLALPDPGGSDRLFEPLVIRAQFTPATDRNPVLARSAAERIIQTRPHDARLDTENLTLWYVETLPVIEADLSHSSADQTVTALGHSRERLADAWAEAPRAVAASGLCAALLALGVSVTPMISAA